jgi:hypothetical protein
MSTELAKSNGRMTILIPSTIEEARTALEMCSGCSRRAASSLLYFVITDEGQYIKIGKTHDMDARLSALQGGNPHVLSIVACFAGKGHLESELHERFAHLRVRNEWFEYTQEIADCIAELEAASNE